MKYNLDGTEAREITVNGANNLRCFAFKRPGDLAFIHGNITYYYREDEFK